MVKLALTAKKSDVLNMPHIKISEHGIMFDELSDVYFINEDTPNLIDLEFTLSDRAYCESDSSLLQILPYISLVDKNTGKRFAYKRGKSGGEDKLKGLHSIGLGGHVEEAPSKNANLIQVLAVNVARELYEEVGLEITAEFIGKIVSMMQMKEYKLIYTTENEVCGFHLCMWLDISVDPAELGSLEEDIITKGQWLGLDELESLMTVGEGSEDSFKLEAWSKICFDLLSANTQNVIDVCSEGAHS